MKRKIGFIGVGKMGSSMVSNLLKNGYSVVVYDISKEAVDRIIELGGEKANSPKEVAERAEIIISSLPRAQDVEETYLGEDGILKSARKGTIIIDTSTISPVTTKKVAEKAAEVGVKVLDAPVSGSPQIAAKGELTLMVGGDKEAFQECEEVLKVLGKTIHYVGGVGSGHIIKLVNNMMSTGNLIVAAEAFCLGVRAGIDPDLLFEVLSTSRGRSHQFVERFPTKVLKGEFQAGFTVDYARKDLETALEMARGLKVPLPVASLCLQVYTAASASGIGEEDFVAVIKIFEEYAKVKARSKTYSK